MGERLVVEIKRNNKPLATSYYHWSAYTFPALTILDSMYHHVLKDAKALTDSELQLAMIKFAENSTPYGYVGTKESKAKAEEAHQKVLQSMPEELARNLGYSLDIHGGLSLQDVELAETLFPEESFSDDNISRNEGVVAISEESMNDQMGWAQAIITVDLDSDHVYNGVAYEYTIQEYLEETEDDDEFITPDEIPQVPIDMGSFDLADAPLVLELVKISASEWLRYKNKIYQIRLE
jgi:hypothetical protein